MRICFVVNEIFAFGLYGGFGALTRTIGKHLVERGIDVYVLMPRLPGQKPVEILDGMMVVSYPRRYYYPYHFLRAKVFFEAVDADIYHSEEVDFPSYYALKAAPTKKHIVTFQDPCDRKDLRVEWHFEGIGSAKRIQREVGATLLRHCARRVAHNADGLFSQANFIIPKTMRLYGLKTPPEFLPNPVEIPKRGMEKSSMPTVCFLARWDPRKRPEVFLELAKKFPRVQFIAMGKSSPQFSSYGEALAQRYSQVSNLNIVGFASEEKSQILERSWIMVNTSYRECLPVSYLEALAHKCAILSYENPDDFASNFGYHSSDQDFAKGLEFLLDNDRWRKLGEDGYHYVCEHHELHKVIEQHLQIYDEILQGVKRK